jgi:hypothetical protein
VPGAYAAVAVWIEPKIAPSTTIDATTGAIARHGTRPVACRGAVSLVYMAANGSDAASRRSAMPSSGPSPGRRMAKSPMTAGPATKLSSSTALSKANAVRSLAVPRPSVRDQCTRTNRPTCGCVNPTRTAPPSIAGRAERTAYEDNPASPATAWPVVAIANHL